MERLQPARAPALTATAGDSAGAVPRQEIATDMPAATEACRSAPTLVVAIHESS